MSTTCSFRHLWLLILLTTLSMGCANRGIGPQGGAVDSIPPVVLRTTPAQGALHYAQPRIEMAFDEYVQLVAPSTSILVSPPQTKLPEVTNYGKKIRLDLKEPLRDSTTYSVHFYQAIQDTHENNTLPNYTLTFSTGSELDSLEVYGTLIDASTLRPMSGVVVGLHAVHDDSVFATRPFDYVALTDQMGQFSITHVRPESYRLFALNDANHDYLYQAGEALAFSDSLITPSIELHIQTDTLWRDTLIGDSLRHLPDSIVQATYYYLQPSDLILHLFNEDFQHHYLEKVTRQERHRFDIIFSAPQPKMPTFKALPTDLLTSDTLTRDTTWVDCMEHSVHFANNSLDTITFFLTDSSAIRMDTIRLAMSYQTTDSVYRLVPTTDTILVVYLGEKDRPKSSKAKRAKGSEAKESARQTFLSLRSNASKSFSSMDTLSLLSETPLLALDTLGIHLSIRKDTVFVPYPYTIIPNDSSGMRYMVLFQSTPGQAYQLVIDSAACQDIYRHANQRQTLDIQFRPMEDYATLQVICPAVDSTAILQLLNDKEQPLRSISLDTDTATIPYLLPGTYYLRMFLDKNRDGRWTTGSLSAHRQPEPMFYFPKTLVLKANWDFEETFRWQTIPQTQQRPAALSDIKKP